MTSEEMEGLSHRIQILGKNQNLNSILLSNNIEQNSQDDVDHILPSSLLDVERQENIFHDPLSPKEKGAVWNVSGGYDARALGEESEDVKRQTLNALMKLSLSIKGGKLDYKNVKTPYTSKIPFVSVTHGSLSDGGYALAMGSYAFATPDSRFQIANPMKGLSFDPIGLSYILPRLGWENRQATAHYPVGSILGLTGYVADGVDMVESGLATHFIQSVGDIGILERALAELPPYHQQGLKKKPIQKYGHVSNDGSSGSMLQDVNAQYRNVAVANLIHAVSDFDAAGQEYATRREEKFFLMDEDPSLVLEGGDDRGDYLEERDSMLFSIAATFEDVFYKEDSLEGIMESLKGIAQSSTDDNDAQVIKIAKELLDGMEAQSPLALHANQKLMTMGKGNKQNLETCMEREKNVLLKLFEKEDFKNWVNSGLEAGGFKDWKHKSVKEVTPDEVKELFASN